MSFRQLHRECKTPIRQKRWCTVHDREVGPDEIVISTHPPGRSNWLERGVVDSVRARYDVPVTHVVVDLEAQAASS